MPPVTPADQMRATGSGRRKVALPPGRSQLDWVRNSARIIPRSPRDVSLPELRRHCNRTDAWVSIDYHVFDVSSYIEYHPGGIDILAAVAGKVSWPFCFQLFGKCLCQCASFLVDIDLFICSLFVKSYFFRTPRPCLISTTLGSMYTLCSRTAMSVCLMPAMTTSMMEKNKKKQKMMMMTPMKNWTKLRRPPPQSQQPVMGLAHHSSHFL